MKPCFSNFLLLLLIKKLLYPGGNGGALLPGLPTALNNIEHIYIYNYIYLYIYIYIYIYYILTPDYLPKPEGTLEQQI